MAETRLAPAKSEGLVRGTQPVNRSALDQLSKSKNSTRKPQTMKKK